MGWTRDVVTEFLDPDLCLPAVGQGALSIECRESDSELLALREQLACGETTRTVTAERAILHKMEGGCQVPIAGFAEEKPDGSIALTGLVASPDGQTIYKEYIVGHDPEELGEAVAESLTNQGAKPLIDQVKEERAE